MTQAPGLHHIKAVHRTGNLFIFLFVNVEKEGERIIHSAVLTNAEKPRERERERVDIIVLETCVRVCVCASASVCEHECEQMSFTPAR
jgi:hypothetical protein